MLDSLHLGLFGRSKRNAPTALAGQLFAKKVGAPYAAAVSSGTSGLHLLAVIAGLGEGDEVITSPYSFVASANCFIYEGAVPVFVDIDERTMNLDPAGVEATIAFVFSVIAAST